MVRVVLRRLVMRSPVVGLVLGLVMHRLVVMVRVARRADRCRRVVRLMHGLEDHAATPGAYGNAAARVGVRPCAGPT